MSDVEASLMEGQRAVAICRALELRRDTARNLGFAASRAFGLCYRTIQTVCKPCLLRRTEIKHHIFEYNLGLFVRD